MIFNVALLQILAVDNDPAANLVRGEAACRTARAMGADLALFPEMWSIGYELGWTEPRPWKDQAIARDDPWLAHFASLAAELEMAIAVTYLERWSGAPRNSLTLFDRAGRPVLTHAKAHLCDWGPEGDLTAGDALAVAELDTVAGPVRIGALICYDREFPESARTLMLKGAEVILIANSCEMEINRISQQRAQAYENMLAMVLTNYPAPKNNGHSIAFDGIPIEAISGPARDMCVVEAGEAEGIVLAEIDVGRLRAYREAESLGQPKGRYRRRPELYRG
jgi:predicted amidohydrolase